MQNEHRICFINLGSDGVYNLFPLIIVLAVFLTCIHSYTGQDPIGVELAGALKNVYAIAAGTADGLGFESNTKAGLPISFFPLNCYSSMLPSYNNSLSGRTNTHRSLLRRITFDFFLTRRRRRPFANLLKSHE